MQQLSGFRECVFLNINAEQNWSQTMEKNGNDGSAKTECIPCTPLFYTGAELSWRAMSAVKEE